METRVGLDLAPLAARLETALGELLGGVRVELERAGTSTVVGGTGSPPPVELRPLTADGARIWIEMRPQPVKARLEGGEVTLDADIAIAAVLTATVGSRRFADACGCAERSWCEGRPGEPLRARLRWSGQLGLGEAFGLAVEPKSKVAIDGSCLLRPRRALEALDVLDLVRSALDGAAQRGAALIEAEAARYEALEEQLAPLWAGLSGLVPLEGDDGRRLALRPAGVQVDDFQPAGSLAAVRARFRLNPVITQREMEPVGDLVLGSVQDAEGFRVLGSFDVSLQRLERELGQELLGRRFPPRSSERFVELTEVEVLGGAQRVIVRLGFEGSSRGDLVLTGYLRANGETAQIEANDIEFTPESLDAIGMLADEVERSNLTVQRIPWMDPEQLENEVARALRKPLTAPLRSVESRAEAAAQRLGVPGRRLRFIVNTEEMLDVSLARERARVVVLFEGEGRLERAAAVLPVNGSD